MDNNQNLENKWQPSFINFEKAHCQSCGLLNDTPELHGTNADGSLNFEYCLNCFQNGTFTEPNLTIDVMATISAGIISDNFPNLSLNDIQTYLLYYLSTLQRWKDNIVENPTPSNENPLELFNPAAGQNLPS